MKFESFRLSDLCIKGEGNLHIIVFNSMTNHVFRFPKEICKEKETSIIKNPESIDTTKTYKISISFKKYNVFQKFWGKHYLPKTKMCLIPEQITDLIALCVDKYRLESRKGKKIIIKTGYIEIQSDLSILPREYKFFTSGNTYCIELKPKFGILFIPEENASLDCRNKISKFCLGQLLRSKGDRTDYCPCDLFSGDPFRMTRAITSLIQCSKEKLRIFEDGKIVNNINRNLIHKLILNLFPDSQFNEEMSLKKFCNLLIQALIHDVSGHQNPLQLPFKYSTKCHGHMWSKTPELHNVPYGISNISSGSVIGRLISTGSLVNKRSEEMKDYVGKLNEFLEENNIEISQNIFDLWNEHLLPLTLPEDIIEIVRVLKMYLICLTVRDCSIMVKLKKASTNKLSVKQSNAVLLKQGDGSIILCKIDVIDIGTKPLHKVQSNFEYEQKLLSFFN